MTDTRGRWWVKWLQVCNLAVRSFVDGEVQTRAYALTSQTLLAVVPALALLFAVGRGLGLQDLVRSQLFGYFPAQRQAIETSLEFVDSYLTSSFTDGLFIAVGVVFLMWTLLNMLDSVEDDFNAIWEVKKGRSLWRKLTDYTLICLVLPVLLIIASAIAGFMTSVLQEAFPIPVISDQMGTLLDLSSFVLVWLFFTGTFWLIPNTHVRFRNALVAGALAGAAFLVLEWLFVSGQIYVTRYNAIYGSFAFLPLLIIWMQFVWVITLTGADLCHAMQCIKQHIVSQTPNS